MEVLKHEMAHQYVAEVHAAVDEPPHGPTFRRICHERGIEAAATGEPGQGDGDHPLLDRVRKLLSLAQSANEHEAQSAARVAQRLMLRHNIDQASADRADGYTSRQLGRVTGRTSEAERLLATILQEHFFVDVIWVHAFRPGDGRWGRVLEVCGRRENVALADYVHAYVSRTADRLWDEHKRAQGIRGNRDRRLFIAGVMTGFRDRLEAQRKEHVGMGLIWIGDPQLGAYFKRRHRRVSVRTYHHGGGHEAREHGRKAGREIVLRRGVEGASAAKGSGLLGSGERG